MMIAVSVLNFVMAACAVASGVLLTSTPMAALAVAYLALGVAYLAFAWSFLP